MKGSTRICSWKISSYVDRYIKFSHPKKTVICFYISSLHKKRGHQQKVLSVEDTASNYRQSYLARKPLLNTCIKVLLNTYNIFCRIKIRRHREVGIYYPLPKNCTFPTYSATNYYLILSAFQSILQSPPSEVSYVKV